MENGFGFVIEEINGVLMLKDEEGVYRIASSEEAELWREYQKLSEALGTLLVSLGWMKVLAERGAFEALLAVLAEFPNVAGPQAELERVYGLVEAAQTALSTAQLDAPHLDPAIVERAQEALREIMER